MLKASAMGCHVQTFRSVSLATMTLAFVVAIAPTSTNQACAGFIVSGQSRGVAVSSELTIATLASANVSVNPLQGNAPATYNQSLTNNLGATISAGAYNLPVLGTHEVLLSGSTGFLNTTAASNINGSSANGSASSSTTIDNLNLNVLGTLSVPVLSINATTLTTNSSASGAFGSLTATGTPSFVGLSIAVLGIDVTALVEASAGVLVDVSGVTGLTGLKIGIDVVTASGDGIATKGVVTDNIIVQFTNVSTLGGTINGQLTIGESQASIVASAVPEPASVVMMGIGLIVVGAAGACRRKQKRSSASA
jgi:hypothetical protein